MYLVFLKIGLLQVQQFWTSVRIFQFKKKKKKIKIHHFLFYFKLDPKAIKKWGFLLVRKQVTLREHKDLKNLFIDEVLGLTSTWCHKLHKSHLKSGAYIQAHIEKDVTFARPFNPWECTDSGHLTGWFDTWFWYEAANSLTEKQSEVLIHVKQDRLFLIF